LERIVRDTTYIERSYLLNSTLKLSAEFKGFLNISHSEVVPDSLASRTLRMARNTFTGGEIGVQYDTRDFPANPRKGIRYMASFSFGTKRNSGPEYLIREDSLAHKEGIKKIKGQLSYFQRLWQNQVFALNFSGSHIEGDKDQLQLSDHFWFGGFGSLRGYRENQFHGTSVSWVNLEYRFIVGRNSRVFLFNDWGFYQYEDASGIKNDILAGYGVGIRFDTPLGVMGVDYGLGRGDTFSTGKIHFGIINSF
jgi:outer membrane protein insertion porin family